MTIEDFMCTWDIYPEFDYDGVDWKLYGLIYLGYGAYTERVGFEKKQVIGDLWEVFNRDSVYCYEIDEWLEWLNENMEQFYLFRCINKTNNPYIDNILSTKRTEETQFEMEKNRYFKNLREKIGGLSLKGYNTLREKIPYQFIPYIEEELKGCKVEFKQYWNNYLIEF